MLKQLFPRFFWSIAPYPSQQSLDGLFKRVTRARVLDGGTSRGKALGGEVLLDVAGAPALTTLHACLAIVEDPRTFGHCMCLGDQALELYAGRRRVATIGLHHGRSIRWDDWKYDALLKDGRRLLDWLAARGVTAPLADYEQAKRRAEAYRQAAVRWQQAMPRSLQPFWEQMQAVGPGMAVFTPASAPGADSPSYVDTLTAKLAPLLQVLNAEYPDLNTRVLELFKWFGSGQGPWSGFPAYEGVAEELLLTFPTDQLLAALADQPLTIEHLEGAARFFAGFHFNQLRRSEAQLISPELKQRLLDHSLASTDEDRIRRAKNAFSG